MSRPIFDIIEAVLDESSAPHLSYQERIAAFKQSVWSAPIYVPGVQAAAADGGKTQLHFATTTEGNLQLMAFLGEAEAIEDIGESGYVTLPFSSVAAFANVQRFEMAVCSHDEALTIDHAMLMSIRDAVLLGETGQEMTETELLEHSLYTRVFAARACEYCALHADIETMHIARLSMPGLRVAIAVTLTAENSDEHADALQEIADDIFLPGWRVIFNHAGDPHIMSEQLVSEEPIYKKAAAIQPLRWWQKLFKPSKPQMGEIPLIQVELLPE
jgi:hypothetical protein